MRRSFVAGFALLLVALPLAAQSVTDHPLVSRYPGTEVLERNVTEFDELLLPLGQIVDAHTFTRSQRVEGQITKFKYSTPPNRSGLEVFANYRDAMTRAGFSILFSCAGVECRSDKFKLGYEQTSTGTWCFSCAEPMRYLAAKGKDAYVAVLVEKDQYEGGTWVTIVEPKPMATGLVTVSAAALANDLATSGHASVYGIYFDTGKAVVKPESDATLSEIQKLLAAHPQMKLFVVGHTDNVGPQAANLALSKARASAVVDALVRRYKVAVSRLQAEGVGQLAPVATNHSDAGRAKNRRVELVEQ